MRFKLCLALILSFPLNAFAGPWSDSLGKSLVEATSAKDRAVLVCWMFTAMSQHTELTEISSVTKEQREAANKAFGVLAMRLLTKDCAEEFRAAVKNEGAESIKGAFQVLGQVAGQELFNDKNVALELTSLDRYIDGEALEKALQEPEPKPAN